MGEEGLHGVCEVEMVLVDVLDGGVEVECDLSNVAAVGSAAGGEAVVSTHESFFDHAFGGAAVAIASVDIIAL